MKYKYRYNSGGGGTAAWPEIEVLCTVLAASYRLQTKSDEVPPCGRTPARRAVFVLTVRELVIRQPGGGGVGGGGIGVGGISGQSTDPLFV